MPSQQPPPSGGDISGLERLYQASLAVAGAHDIDAAMQAIVDAARDLAQAEVSALGVPGPPGQPMAHFYFSGVSDDVVRKLGAPPSGHGMLGLLFSVGKIIRADDILEHPSAVGYPAGHPPVGSFLGIPIRAGGQVIGDLYLGNKIGADGFTEQDERLTEMLATHAAVVIQSLRFQEQAHQLAAMSDRERIARELQDGALQAMYGSGLILRNLDLASPEQAAKQLEEAQAYLESAIDQLRAHLLGLTHARSSPPEPD